MTAIPLESPRCRERGHRECEQCGRCRCYGVTVRAARDMAPWAMRPLWLCAECRATERLRERMRHKAPVARHPCRSIG